MLHVDVRQLGQHRIDVVEEEVGHHRDERGLAQEAGERAAQAVEPAQIFQAFLVLISVEAVNHLVLADARADRLQLLEAALEGDHPERVLEEHRRHPDGGDGAGHGMGDEHVAAGRGRSDRTLGQRVDAAAGRARVVGDHHHAGGRRLLEVADDQRREVGERRLRPVDVLEAIAGLPVAQADEVEAVAVEQAAMLAEGELTHPLEDDQLDLADLRQVDQRGDLLLARPHGIGTRATTSFTTSSAVRPWLAACGPSQMRWLRMYGARSWMSSG